MSVGVPIKILHDAEGHVITLESVDGEVYRGKLVEAEDNMNVHMANLIMTTREGRTVNMDSIYIRGSKIRFFILPDMLKNSPMIRRPQGAKGITAITARGGKASFIRSTVAGRGMRGAPRGGAMPKRGRM
ncbi:Small nuclear ribonucleoprotein Sm D3 [Cichlidogyrus casuarinus]|uniref:Small nuclear ribonucleoprotein Sm D3 n=1 Tax=Cichlidogyrus casuarinus TaxID=1844966 RepID=A0ABD2PSK3_9PLAT